MGFINGDALIALAAQYRCIFIDGRYGGGKTILAYRMAYELRRRHGYRYIYSNVRSIINDDPTRMEFRVTPGGVFVDAVLILDEGGMYLDSPREAKQWLAFLRKLNVVLLIPTVLPPSILMRRITVQRSINWMAFGVPLWSYQIKVASGMSHVRQAFYWWQPSEMFGIYDTVGMPDEASELLDRLRSWVKEAQKLLGYGSQAVSAWVEPDFSEYRSATETDALYENTLAAEALGNQIGDAVTRLEKGSRRR